MVAEAQPTDEQIAEWVRESEAATETKRRHYPIWSNSPGGSITDGKCAKCQVHYWPCGFVRDAEAVERVRALCDDQGARANGANIS